MMTTIQAIQDAIKDLIDNTPLSVMKFSIENSTYEILVKYGDMHFLRNTAFEKFEYLYFCHTTLTEWGQMIADLSVSLSNLCDNVGLKEKKAEDSRYCDCSTCVSLYPQFSLVDYNNEMFITPSFSGTEYVNIVKDTRFNLMPIPSLSETDERVYWSLNEYEIEAKAANGLIHNITNPCPYSVDIREGNRLLITLGRETTVEGPFPFEDFYAINVMPTPVLQAPTEDKVWDFNTSIKEAVEDPRYPSCNHSWKETVGFSSIYRDCVACGAKG